MTSLFLTTGKALTCEMNAVSRSVPDYAIVYESPNRRKLDTVAGLLIVFEASILELRINQL